MTTTYQKIPGPFVRDPKTNKLTQELISPALEAVKDTTFLFTEKIDGTNVRIIWDGHRVSFAGRTDNAQFHPDLFDYLNDHFGGEDRENLFEQKFGADPVVIYGEGFGPKIQSGGKYLDHISLAIFDVVIGGLYLFHKDVVDIAGYFGVPTAPVVLASGTLQEGIDFIRDGFTSTYGDFPAEGIVGVTHAGLRDRRGERIIVKIKARDFAD